MASAASATVRVSGPWWAMVPSGDVGKAGTRARVGFSPKQPVKAAGMRIEPPPSVPSCKAPMPSTVGRDRARRGSARRHARVPRIAREAGERAVAGGLPAVFGHRRLAEHDRAVLLQARHGRRIEGLRIGAGELRAEACRHARDRDVVLDAQRHAVGQPLGRSCHPSLFRCLGRRQRTFRIEVAIGVDRAVEALDARQRGLHGFNGRQPLRAIERRPAPLRTRARDRWRHSCSRGLRSNRRRLRLAPA